MSRLTITRLSETFFRHWFLFLLPVLALAGLGGYSVATQARVYQSLGSVNVANSTLVSSLTDVRGTQTYGYDTAAGATAKQVNSLLQTDQFVRDVATKAGLDPALQAGQTTLGAVRASVSAWTNGPNLLIIAASFPDPVVAQRLASSTITAFSDSVVTSSLGDSATAEAFFGTLLQQYKADVDGARADVDTWLKAHPAPAVLRTRPESEQNELKQLNDALTQATDRYNAALAKSDSAQLAALQARSDTAQRLKIVDPPVVPVVPTAGLKAMVLKFALFFVLGALLSSVFVVLGSMFDRAVRLGADVGQRLELALMAVVPDHGHVPFAPSPVLPRRSHRRRSGPAVAVPQAS